MNKMQRQILAAVMAAATALSPVAASAAAVYDTGPFIGAETEGETSAFLASDSGDSTAGLQAETQAAEETRRLSIDLLDGNGYLLLNEGTDSEVRLKVEDGKAVFFDAAGVVTDRKDIGIYTAELEERKDSIISIRAVANSGYLVSMFTVAVGDGNAEDAAGFTAGTYDSFNFSQMMADNAAVTVAFEKKPDTPNNTAAQASGSAETAVRPDEDDTVILPGETGETKETKETDEETVILPSETQSETAAAQSGPETESEAQAGEPETQSEAESEALPQQETGEHGSGEEELPSAADFRTARLVVLGSREDIFDPEHIIGEYQNLFLLQYETPGQAIDAYTQYVRASVTVEPDADVEAAGEAGDGAEAQAEGNPVDALNDAQVADTESAAAKSAPVIALIDTGIKKDKNVVGQASLIDDKMAGGQHGTEMLRAIRGENENALVLSIRALGDDGHGTIASIASAIEYAIKAKADIINLSLYAKKNLASSVLEQEIQKAVSAGIIVVGAAGNAGADASAYVPGSVEAAVIVGAMDENGIRLPDSNYGPTVDYYVMADSTSEAAAKVSGKMSLGNGAPSGNDVSTKADSIPDETETVADTDINDFVRDEDRDKIWQYGTAPDGTRWYITYGNIFVTDSGEITDVNKAAHAVPTQDNEQDDVTAAKLNRPERWPQTLTGTATAICTTGAGGKLLGASFSNVQFSSGSKKKIPKGVKLPKSGTNGSCKNHTAAVPDRMAGSFSVSYSRDKSTSKKTKKGGQKMTLVYTGTYTPPGATDGVTRNEYGLIGYQRLAITIKFTVTEEPENGYLRVQKLSANPEITNNDSYYSLAGAQYGIYESAADANADQNREDTVVIDSDGFSDVSDPLDIGTHYVKEVAAPFGFNLDQTVYTAVVQGANSTKNPVTIVSTDVPAVGAVALKKVPSSASGSITSGNSCYSIAGAQYGLYFSQSDAQNNYNRIGTLVTDTNGNTGIIEHLMAGTYYIRELSASPGYLVDTAVHPITVQQGNTRNNPAVITVSENASADPVGLLLKKRDKETGEDVRRVEQR